MRNLFILLLFLSGYCYSQEPVFNFEKNKAYKITMKGADDFKKADLIARTMEKNQLSIFAYVDPSTSAGCFIVDNFYKVHEIEKMINNQAGFSYVGFEEIPLNEELFLDIYMKRGGYNPDEFASQPPKKIIMGPFNELSNSLNKKAIEIWEKKYKK